MKFPSFFLRVAFLACIPIATEIEHDDGSGTVAAGGFPVITGNDDLTVGYGRFDEAGASAGSTITSAQDETPNNLTATGTGSGGGVYSTDVPGATIYDRVTQTSHTNTFSMDASASNRRMEIANKPLLNTSFTIESFIKIVGEPTGYQSFIQRTDNGTSRFQVNFDHGNSGSFGRLRCRWDTPDGENTNFVLGPVGGAAVPENQRIWRDTDVGDGLVSSYNDPSDWANDGDGQNDVKVWNHFAVTFDQDTEEVKFYFNHELLQTRTLNDADNSGYVFPNANLVFGKFGGDYGLLMDELRYSGRVLEETDFLKALASPPAIFSSATNMRTLP